MGFIEIRGEINQYIIFITIFVFMERNLRMQPLSHLMCLDLLQVFVFKLYYFYFQRFTNLWLYFSICIYLLILLHSVKYSFSLNISYTLFAIRIVRLLSLHFRYTRITYKYQVYTVLPLIKYITRLLWHQKELENNFI